MTKSHLEKMKTQLIFKHTFDEWKSLYVRLPLQLLEYLATEYSMTKERRFSKIKAFKFLFSKAIILQKILMVIRQWSTFLT